MNLRLAYLLLVLSTPSYVVSHSIEEINKFCSNSRDYLGCVHTNREESKTTERTNRTQDFIKYGYIYVNWSLLRSNQHSLLVPALNKDKKEIFLAFNCDNKLLNIKQPESKWKGWFSPTKSFERKLLLDICSIKYSLNNPIN